MTVTVLTNTVDTNLILSNQIIVDMDPTIQKLEDDAAPLVKFSRRVGQKSAHSPKFEWLESELHPRLTTLAASYTSGTSITVASGTGSYFKGYDVIRNDATGENMLVVGVTGDVLTVQRAIGASNGYGGVSSTNSVGSSDNIIRVSNASAEGSKLPAIRIAKKVAKSNYVQDIRTPFGFTEVMTNTDLYGGNEPAQEAKQKLIEHLREIEHTFFWGQQKIDLTGSTPRRFSGGLIDFIQTNKTPSAGTLTQRTFDDFLESASRYGSGRKVLFAAPIVARAISSFANKQTVPTDLGSRKFGMFTTSYTALSGGLTVEIVVKPDWRDFSTANNGMAGAAFLVDMDAVTFRYLQNSNTRLRPNRQDNDETSDKQEYQSIVGLQVNHERRHALLTGVTNFTSGVT